MEISKIVILLLANSTLGYTSGNCYDKYTPYNYYNYQIYNNMTMHSNNFYRNIYRNNNKKSDRSNNKQKIEKEFISLDSIKNKINSNEQIESDRFNNNKMNKEEFITLDDLNNKINDNKYDNSQIKSDRSNNKQKIEKEFISLDSIKNKINDNEQRTEKESITLDNFNNENIIINDDNLESTYLNMTPIKNKFTGENNINLSNSQTKGHADQDSIFKEPSIELLQIPKKESIRLPNSVKGQNEKYTVYTKNNKLPILTEKVSQDSKTITLDKENITENKIDQFKTSETKINNKKSKDESKIHNTLKKFKDLTETIITSYNNRKGTDTKEIIISDTLNGYGTKKINEITDGFNEYNNDKLSSNNIKNLLLPLLRMAGVSLNKDSDDRKLLNETTNSIKCDKEKNKLSNEVKQTIIKNNNNEDKVSNKIIDNNEEEILNKEVPISNNNKQLLDDKISIMNKIDEEHEINETNSDINYLINTLETIKSEIDTYKFISSSLNHMDTKGHLNNDNKNMFKYKINTPIADYYSVNGGLENHCFDYLMNSNIDYRKYSDPIKNLMEAKNNYFSIKSILKTIEHALNDNTKYNPSIYFKYSRKSNNEFDLEIKLNNKSTNNKNILIFGFNKKKKKYFIRTMYNNIKEQIVEYEEEEIKNNKTFSSKINKSENRINELKTRAQCNKKELCKLLGMEEGEILEKNKVSIYGVNIEASGDKLFISSKEEDNNNYNRIEYNGKKRKRNKNTDKSNSSSKSNSHEKYDSHK